MSVDSSHVGEVEFVSQRLQSCCCDQTHRASFTSSSSSSSSSCSSSSSSTHEPPPGPPTTRRVKNLESFLGVWDSGPGSPSREAAERAALESLQYQEVLREQGGQGRKDLTHLLGVVETHPPKSGFSLPQVFLEATRRVLDSTRSSGRSPGRVTMTPGRRLLPGLRASLERRRWGREALVAPTVWPTKAIQGRFVFRWIQAGSGRSMALNLNFLCFRDTHERWRWDFRRLAMAR